MLADAEEWDRGPWSGDVHEGEVWGRGALDMKGEVAANAVAMASLARDGFEPRGDLIFVAAADEEVNVGFGLAWLCEAHPEAVRAEYALNEGGGERVELGGKPFYLVSTAEKMSAPFVIRTRGRAGHGSVPSIADNALLKAAPLIERLGAYKHPPQHTPETEAFFRAVTGEVPPIEQALERAGELHPMFGLLLEALVGPTYAPTMIEASKKRNVIPSLCEITVDSRILPGQTPAESETIVRSVLGDGDYELDWIEASGGTRSPVESPLWDTLEAWVRQERSRSRARADAACRASPTATGCARRSAPSRTASSRCARWTLRSPRCSSTRRTSGSPSTTSSSRSTSTADAAQHFCG